MKNTWICLILLVSFIFLPQDVFAAEGAIFDKLAGKAGQVGSGLRQVGFVIAGLGLIVFSIAAIMNKLNWKTLFYIMLSTFILSFMTMVISTMSGGSSGGYIPSVSGNGNTGPSSAPGDASSVHVNK